MASVDASVNFRHRPSASLPDAEGYTLCVRTRHDEGSQNLDGDDEAGPCAAKLENLLLSGIDPNSTKGSSNLQGHLKIYSILTHLYK